MESFVDPHSMKPVREITLTEGQTKVVGLKKFALGPPPEVVVSVPSALAFCHQVNHLKDPTKRKYSSGNLNPDDHYWYRMSSFTDEMVPVEHRHLFLFQVGGRTAGRTQLTAETFKTREPVADPIPVIVTEDKRRLTLAAAPGFPPPTVDLLWKNHPMNPNQPGGSDEHPCKVFDKEGRPVSTGANQCMVRFCTALERSGGSFAGLHGAKCRFTSDDAHHHHYINPYDFEAWKKSKVTHFVWEAKPPFQPEPMPGLAAFTYMLNRKGIVLFWNYFMRSMFGGHIDVWHQTRMGNNYVDRVLENFTDGEGAFFRARKIVFWPMD